MTATPIMIIGRNGQLARELADLAWPVEVQPHFLGRGEIDLFDMNAVDAHLRALRPAAIVNTAAYTAVDLAESQPVMAALLNADMPAGLAQIASRQGIPLVHLSTDYVFAGDSDRPYRELDAAAPASVYGQTKLAGERAVLTSGARATILRSAGLFGRHGQNFLKTMIARSHDLRPVSMVSDQIHTPTPAAALAALTRQIVLDLMAGRDLPHLMHVAGQPLTTWFDLTTQIFGALRAAGRTALPSLQPVALSDFPRRAPRPRYSALDCNLATSLGYAVPAWEAVLPALVHTLAQERIAA
ncbi:dTDP-4-dehydrorhamnose reductase [Dongia rigui]|uniref:dTDP-4-dehydrorhamnose reductase n=2 Tax=Dongia rigui TaxID=940149 RepID=A0ABU5DUP1_9PROT|nr:dTDP-4-dehydrorhamnose reductase [Dongia rigui]